MKKIYVVLIGVLIIAMMGCEQDVINNTVEPLDRGDGNNNVVIIKEDNEPEAILEGRVTNVSDTGISLETEGGDPYVVHFNDDIVYAETVSSKFEIDNLVSIGFSGEVMESYPMQINAQKILLNEPQEKGEISGTLKVVEEDYVVVEDYDGNEYKVMTDDVTYNEGVSDDLKEGNLVSIEISKKILNEKLQTFEKVVFTINEENQMITIDPREVVSGYINEFPMVIITSTDPVVVPMNSVFAIALEENASTGYFWEILMDGFTLEMTGDGMALNNSDLVGAPSTHYYGFRAITQGEHTITFKLIASDQSIAESVDYLINVE